MKPLSANNVKKNIVMSHQDSYGYKSLFGDKQNTLMKLQLLLLKGTSHRCMKETNQAAFEVLTA